MTHKNSEQKRKKKSLKPEMSQDILFHVRFGLNGMASVNLNSHSHLTRSTVSRMPLVS